MARTIPKISAFLLKRLGFLLIRPEDDFFGTFRVIKLQGFKSAYRRAVSLDHYQLSYDF